VIDAADLARRAYFSGLRATGAGARARRRLAGEGRLVILNLHRVSPEGSRHWPPLHPRLFEDMVRFLRRNARPVTFGDLPAEGLQANDRPLVILSFDDGYKDFVEYAMPILSRSRIRVNHNIIPGSVVTGRPPWTVRLSDFLSSAPPDLLRRTGRLASRTLGIPDDPRFGQTLIRRLKSLPRPARAEFWDELEPLLQHADGEGTAMMSLADVRQAADHHEIGVHSYSHESMEFETDDYFLHDLRRCRGFFDEELRLPMRIYAFPNGSYRKEQVRVLRDTGFEHVLLVGERASSPTDRVHHRFTFGGSSRSEVRLRSLGWTRPS
jgi:peptidoglycan/xylan/chitin deacetylase (PgdA/CDA1 family)